MGQNPVPSIDEDLIDEVLDNNVCRVLVAPNSRTALCSPSKRLRTQSNNNKTAYMYVTSTAKPRLHENIGNWPGAMKKKATSVEGSFGY